MANVILPDGYESLVRTDLGVDEEILPDLDIQGKANLAEALTKRAVPDYEGMTDDALIFLQSACVAQLCALLCPGMPNRVKTSETSETKYSYKLQEVDWAAKKEEFQTAISDFLSIVKDNGEFSLPAMVGVVVNDKLEI